MSSLQSNQVAAMKWKGIFKFFLGVSLAIALLIGGGVAAALYFFFQVTSAPPKPIFVNDKPSVKAQVNSTPNTANSSAPTPQTTATSSTPTPTPQALAAGTYKARVTWADGLSVRSEPNLDSERIAGAAYNEELIVLEESADKSWQRVRLDNSQQEGWIKAGNTQRVEAQ